jgi:hypothetical protein
MSKEEEYPEDVIDGRGEDDGFLSAVIEKARAFSDEILKIYPSFHPGISQDALDMIRKAVEVYSFVGFRRGYLEGFNDAKQQDNA